MKRIDMFELVKVIDEVLPKSKKVKLNMYLHSNKDLLDKEIENLKNSIVVGDEIKEYEHKRITICKLFCKKDDDNNPILINNSYQGLVDNKEFEKEMLVLNTEYKTHIEEYGKQVLEYEELLQEESTIELDKFDVDIIPDDLIDGSQFKYIRMLLKD